MFINVTNILILVVKTSQINITTRNSSMEKFDSEITEITATIEQLEFLNGPPSIPALKAADFLGNQKYIDEWVANWLLSMDLPLITI